MIEELIARVFTRRDQAHLAHWKTHSYSEHMALGSFYEDVLEPLDDLVEDYQAIFGLIKELKGTYSTTDNILEGLKEDIKWINKNRDTIVKDICALENILDTLSDVYLKTIYKLENLK